MKALTYTQAHPIDQFSIELSEVPKPTLRPFDLLIEVKAFSVNPVDMKVRGSRSSSDKKIILGWDVAGIVREMGPEVQNFKIGDEVFAAGDLNRDGSNAEFVAIDSRIAAKKPRSLSFAEAAALPLTMLTGWEALIEKKDLALDQPSTVLIVGGAGGVGSATIQILKAKTKAKVIATASRPETAEWCQGLGADEIIDHRKDLAAELKRIGVDAVDVIFSTTHTDSYLQTYPQILRPFGHLVVIDDPKSLDIIGFKRKALSVQWELMFTKTLFNHNVTSQGKILEEVAKLVDEGKIKTTANKTLSGMTPQNLKTAHEIAEKSQAIGKIVITLS